MIETRWFVLTPTPFRAAWEAAIAAAAAEAGWTLLVDSAPDGEEAVAERRLILVDDVEAVPLEHRAAAVGLMADTAFAGGVVADRDQVDEAVGWRAASKVLTSASLALGDRLARLEVDAGGAIVRCGDLELIAPTRVASAGTPRHDFLKTYLRLPMDRAATFHLGVHDIVYNDPPSRPTVDGAIDMTGRPRIASFGPYLWVPPGEWRATAEFAVDADGARQEYAFQWGDLETMSERRFRPGKPGPYRLEIDVVVRQPAALELRIVKIEGTISGQMRFGGLTISRID